MEVELCDNRIKPGRPENVFKNARKYHGRRTWNKSLKNISGEFNCDGPWFVWDFSLVSLELATLDCVEKKSEFDCGVCGNFKRAKRFGKNFYQHMSGNRWTNHNGERLEFIRQIRLRIYLDVQIWFAYLNNIY